jgi:hypothetical protein
MAKVLASQTDSISSTPAAGRQEAAVQHGEPGPSLVREPFRAAPHISSSAVSDQQPHIVHRIGSNKERRMPPPVPDADGFVPISSVPRRPPANPYIARAANHQQQQQGFAGRSSGKERRLPESTIPGPHDSVAASHHTKDGSVDTSISRIQRGSNNITYISIGGVDDSSSAADVIQRPKQPTPPPDYDDNSEQEPIARMNRRMDHNNSGNNNTSSSNNKMQPRHVYEPQATFIRRF